MNLSSVDRKNVKLVCKQMRELVYSTVTDMKVRIDHVALCDFPHQMNKLQYLHVYSSYDRSQREFEVSMLVHFLMSVSCNALRMLTLEGMQLGDGMDELINTLTKRTKLFGLDCIDCSRVNIKVLKSALQGLRSIKYCTCDVTLDDDPKVEFASIANALVGKVNLNIGTLERVPSTLLKHPWQCYRARNPSGQFYDMYE